MFSQSTPAFFKKYIGVPYEVMDCFEIVAAFYDEVLGTPLNINPTCRCMQTKEAAAMISSYLGDLQEVPKGQNQFGDILLLRLFGIPAHLGIYLGNNQIVHTQHKVGCVIDNFTRWERMIESSYRIQGQSKT